MSILVSLLPVFVFLVVFVLLDSFKLITPVSLFISICSGCLIALLALAINYILFNTLHVEGNYYPLYVAPVIEESLKAAYLLYLIQARKIGFMVDGAIYGFAIGAGFAFTENIYYLKSLHDANILLWIIRGFGTAMMHGGTTAMCGIITKNLSDRYPEKPFRTFVPGIVIAVIFHSMYNHFFLSPVLSTILLLVILPGLLILVFKRSEQVTREWLGVGLDADMELLNLITTGNLTESKIGQYLHSLKSHFPGEIIIDMLCLLRIHTEFSIRAKGILMMREMGFTPEDDPEIKEKFEELRYLEQSIGATGKMAMAPFLHTSSRDLWQLYMLEK